MSKLENVEVSIVLDDINNTENLEIDHNLIISALDKTDFNISANLKIKEATYKHSRNQTPTLALTVEIKGFINSLKTAIAGEKTKTISPPTPKKITPPPPVIKKIKKPKGGSIGKV